MKKLCLSLTLAVVATLLIVMPVLASYFAYIYVHETAGNTYDNLPVVCTSNITQLVATHFITSSGLDTRVLTGSGDALPHMLANDKILFSTDLEAYEDRTLIFYTGATSLSNFPVILGPGGLITTPDDPTLEKSYVFELLASGYFNSTAGTDKNIVYKEDAFKTGIQGTNNLTVQSLNTSDATQWEMHYDNFTTGQHDVYVLSNGLAAYLYVDSFSVAKDTQNLFETNTVQCIGGNIVTSAKCFYDEGLYWVFYKYDADDFGYITSADGNSWSNATTFRNYGNETMSQYWDAKMRDGYIYFSYEGIYGDNTDNLCFRKGDLEANSTITWSADWQVVATETAQSSHSFNQNFIAIDSTEHPYIFYGTIRGSGTEYGSISKSSTTNGTWTTAGGYPFDIYNYGIANSVLQGLIMYPDSDEIFALWQYFTYAGVWQYTRGDYYNGGAWSGVIELGSYINTQIYGEESSMAADENGNLYFTWQTVAPTYNGYLTIRHTGGAMEGPYLIAASSSPDLSYNEDNDCLYIIYPSGAYIYGFTLDTIEMEFNTPVAMCARQATSNIYGTSPYEDNIGFLMLNTNTFHTYVDLTVYQWNDNGNNWYWMQGDIMPYADQFILAVDGVSVLEYQPDTIIQGTTLPDETSTGNNGIITWGTNPAGVTVSISGLQSEQSYNETYYYQYLNPGSTDIIKPEPEGMGADVDLVRLHGNPLYPLVQVLTIAGFLTERLVWLGLAWFIVIVAMFLVHLGFGTHRDSEKPQHFILTTVTGLGLSIMFYAMGIFPLWVIILMAFGLVGAVIWERQPVI